MATAKLQRLNTAHGLFPSPQQQEAVLTNYKKVHSLLYTAKALLLSSSTSTQREDASAALREAHKILFAGEEESSIGNSNNVNNSPMIPPHTSNIEEKIDLLIELAELSKAVGLIAIANSCVDCIISHSSSPTIGKKVKRDILARAFLTKVLLMSRDQLVSSTIIIIHNHCIYIYWYIYIFVAVLILIYLKA